MILRKSQRAPTAYHEAGHVVIAYVLGYKPKAATIIPAGDAAGVVH
jgi:ATP-dependent Zn protease